MYVGIVSKQSRKGLQSLKESSFVSGSLEGSLAKGF